MCAERLKIVARNAQAGPRDGRTSPRRSVYVYALNLSDEHMAHVYRFLGLAPFDREAWLRMRGFCAWKISNKRLMDERDAAKQQPPTLKPDRG